jgi:hypothetical protein
VNQNTTIGLVTAGGAAAAGAFWLARSAPRINQGGLQVVQGEVIPPNFRIQGGQLVEQEDQAGDSNTVTSMGGREYPLGSYDAEHAAYEYAVSFYGLIERAMRSLRRLIPAEKWRAIVADYASTGHRKVRASRFCTPGELEAFRGLLRIAMAFGQSHSECWGTARLPRAGSRPMRLLALT